MKNLILSIAFLLAIAPPLAAQAVFAPDTLLVEDFEEDPTLDMSPFPSGFDQIWINYDADNLQTECGDNVPVPGGWFWEGDLSKFGDPTKSNFTSCSFFGDDESLRNENWLMLPPIVVPDSSYQLSWRSQPYQGPAYLDGYLVLVSTSTNIPEEEVFSDTLFKAAEMLQTVNPNSLNLNNFTFSEGYIHADGFTLTQYFDRDTLIIPGIPPIIYYRGRFEPHSVSLAQYSGQTIYVAFLHNSQSDYLLQLDDIVVSKNSSNSTGEHTVGLRQLTIQPNPVHTVATIGWELDVPQECRLQVLDIHGRLLWQNAPAEAPKAVFSQNIDVSSWPSGTYLTVLQTAGGQAIRRFIKP
jgi:hypothetical protein